VNGVCHQFFSGAAFAADENGDIGVRNPSNHLKNFRHLVACAQNVVEAVSLLQFFLKRDVFAQELSLLIQDHLLDLETLSDHGGDDREKADIFFKGDLFAEKAIGTQCPQNMGTVLDGHTDERDITLRQVFSRLGSVEKERFLLDLRNDHGFACFDDLSRDSFSNQIFSSPYFVSVNP